MADGNNRRLTKKEVEVLLARLEKEVTRPECWSCECLQGFIAQLELDAREEARPLLARYKKVSRDVQHGAGCEPCLPSEIFAEYLVRRREANA